MAAIAKSVVNECLRARPGEAISISTYPHTIELANELAAECYRADAEPLMLLDTDEFFYDQFKLLTEEQLRRPSPHCLGLADYVTASIWLGGPKDPKGMQRVPASKWTAYYEGEDPHYNKMLEKKTRSVGLSLGSVTRERARTYGFSYATWKRSVEDGLKVKYADLQRIGKVVGALLSLPQKVQVTAPNGTDLRFRLETRKAHVNDGIIDDEDIAAGNTSVNLPAGDVSIAPEEISARGTIVGDVPIPLQGKLVEGLAFTFADGRVTQIDGKRNAKLVQDGFAGGTGDKDRLASLTVGLNPKLRPGFLTSSLARGVVTVGIGDNRGLGGTNKASWGFYASVANATLTVGGKTIVDGGKLAL